MELSPFLTGLLFLFLLFSSTFLFLIKTVHKLDTFYNGHPNSQHLLYLVDELLILFLTAASVFFHGDKPGRKPGRIVCIVCIVWCMCWKLFYYGGCVVHSV
jgi:hypothetical protein